MSRYTGPRVKILRALGIDLPGLTRKSLEARPHPPGQHGLKQRRISDYGLQLREKQKLRLNYGLTERQLRSAFREANKGRTPTGTKLIELLERRLDNVVFRGGFAPSIPAARQLVRHAHLLLNGKKVDIPSIRLRIGDVVSVKEVSRKHPVITETLKQPALERPEWLGYDAHALQLTLTHLPGGGDQPFPLEVGRVVEWYAKNA